MSEQQKNRIEQEKAALEQIRSGVKAGKAKPYPVPMYGIMPLYGIKPSLDS